jgi:hypothetical protein
VVVIEVEIVVYAVILVSAVVCEVIADALDILVTLVLVNEETTVPDIVAIVTAIELYALDIELW